LPGLEKINTDSNRRVRILFAPLDWGLGHTTRCLPIIKAFLHAGAEISVACNERQSHLLSVEIPTIRLIHLNGYDLNYSKHSWLARAKIAWQIPKILTAIKRENAWLHSLLGKEKFDMVISDNRFGLYHPSVYCVYITHQLRIAFPGSHWLESRLQKWHFHYINQFNECWVPDFEGDPNLSGKLSHPNQLPEISLKYIGGISRFQHCHHSTAHHADLVILISGPELQRTVFEDLITAELHQFPGSAVVVRGLPHATTTKKGFRNISFFNHLPTAELCELLKNAKMVICRSGYSTIMDIVALRKKSILIPTPGQTEQEYLAEYLMEKKYCLAFQQHHFSLSTALEHASVFDYADLNNFKMNQLELSVQNILQVVLKESIPDASRKN
jgi:uncharacterized protein (TIGR00661 family)